MAYKDPEKARANARAYYYANREKRLRQCKEWQSRNHELVLWYSRNMTAKRRKKMMVDCVYCSRERARSRKARAIKRVVQGKVYHPHFRKRLPEWSTLCQRVLDARSQWLDVNLTASQRAYARDLAIERSRQH